MVSKQGLVLRDSQQAAADAVERQKLCHAELLKMMATLMNTNREGGAQQKYGGEQRLSAVEKPGRDAASPSLDRSDNGTGSKKEEGGGAAGAHPIGGRLGGREQVWGVGPLREVSKTPAESLRSRPFLGQAIPVLKKYVILYLFQQMRVY